MKQFWLCFFLITSFSIYAEDAVTRATSYGSENISSDSVTSATEYAGMPKEFENNKPKNNFPIEKETPKVKPEVVLSQRADDESLRTESSMRFLPETFEYIPPIQPEIKKNPPVAVPYYQSYSPELSSLPLPKEAKPTEVSLGEDYLRKMNTLPNTFVAEKPTVVLPEEISDMADINSKMQDLPQLKEMTLPEVGVGEDYLRKMNTLPDTFVAEKPTVVLPEEISDMTYDTDINSKMLELPLPEALPEENISNDENLPFIWEEEVPLEEPAEKEDYDEDLPTLIDVPEISLGETKDAEVLNIPDIKLEKDEILGDDNEFESEWVYKKDYRKLMDFNEDFDGFPKSDEDVFNNPAEYQYDKNGIIVESGRKIDDKIGQELFDSAIKNIKENKNSKAVKLLKELLHYNFNVPETEYLLALAEFKNKNYEEALKYLNRSCEKYKNPHLVAKNMELIGEINFSQKKYREAYQNFIDAVVGVNSEQDAVLYNKAGIAALRAGDIENARKAWKTGKYLGNRDAKRNLLWLDH